MSQTFIDALTRRNLKIATAESCTGGLLSHMITQISGASHVLDRGFVTYSNDAKIETLNVPAETIEKHGAVSEQTAKAMAEGALANSNAQIAISITGIAGPDGGTPDKPVGTVCFGVAYTDTTTQTHHFTGDRQSIQTQAAETAMTLILEMI